MNTTDISFIQKWDVMISLETQMAHCQNAFYNHIVTIATATSFVALAVLSSLIFPEIASFLLIATAFLLTPGIELARVFLNRAQDSKKLEDQALKVRVIYNRLLAVKADNPQIRALHEHWSEKALKAQKSYQIVLQKAIDKADDPNAYTAVITKYRTEALEVEQQAKIIGVYALFLEGLINKPKAFKDIFLKHGEDFSKALLDFGTWDCRDTLIRATDPKFAKKDILFTFTSRKTYPIFYSEVYQNNLKLNLKNRLIKTL